MSRYTRLLNEDHDQSSSSAPPTSAFQNNNNNTNNTSDSDNTQTNSSNYNNNKFSNMFQQLKESAAAAGGSVRENMGKASNSVRGGLGLPPGGDDSNNNADDEEQSVASSFIDEASEYCPQMSYQQVRQIVDRETCFEFVCKKFQFRDIFWYAYQILFVYVLTCFSFFIYNIIYYQFL